MINTAHTNNIPVMESSERLTVKPTFIRMLSLFEMALAFAVGALLLHWPGPSSLAAVGVGIISSLSPPTVS